MREPDVLDHRIVDVVKQLSEVTFQLAISITRSTIYLAIALLLRSAFVSALSIPAPDQLYRNNTTSSMFHDYYRLTRSKQAPLYGLPLRMLKLVFHGSPTTQKTSGSAFSLYSPK